MMQRVLTGAVAAVALSASSVSAKEVATESSKPGVPLLTVSGTYDFLYKSLILASDLTQFTTVNAVTMVMEYLPPDVYRQAQDMYEDALSQADTLRIQNGVPTFAAMKKEAMREYEKTAQPIIDGAIKQGKIYGAVPIRILKNVVLKFEKEYPSSKGLLSSEVFDFALTIMFLVYYVMDYIIGMFCYIFCCGMCAKRKKATPSVVPSKAVVPKTSDPKKKAR